MPQDGIGVLINEMFGSTRPADELHASCAGRVIRRVRIDEAANDGDGALEILFEGGEVLWIRDEGRSCCERRYLHTDDDLSAYRGATLLSIALSQGPEKTDDWDGVHEQMFLRIVTSAGPLVVETHNQHNGYYGGFFMNAELRKQEESGGEPCD